MPALFILSPNPLLASALTLHLAKLGLELSHEAGAADAALVDLCSLRGALTPPPPLPSLALVWGCAPPHLAEVLRLGYRGYLCPDDPAHLIVDALETVFAGGLWILVGAQPCPDAKRPAPLTRRELEVLDLLSEGLSNKAIAKRLGIAEKTVKVHVSAILGKCRARSRLELLVRGTLEPELSRGL